MIFSVTAHADSVIFISNFGDGTIRQVSSSGVVTSFATGLSYPRGLVLDGAGHLYVASASGTIHKYAVSGADLGVFTSSGLHAPVGLAIDQQGNLYAANSNTNTIEKYSAAGVDQGVFANTGLSFPMDLRFDNSGNLYVANYNSKTIEKFSSTGVDQGVFATLTFNPDGLYIDSSNNIYVTGGSTVEKYNTAGTHLETFASGTSSGYMGITFDSQGNLYAVDSSVGSIEKFSSAGVDQGALATGLSTPQYLVAQPVTYALGTTSLTEGPTAGTDTVDLGVTPAGFGWTASSNAAWLHVAASGNSGGPVAFTFDANAGATRSGTLTIAGQTLTVTQAGSTYVAAAPFTVLAASGFNYPFYAAPDSSGNVFIADADNSAIKKWSPATNAVTTIVGSGLMQPEGIAVNAAGDLFIPDTHNNAIKKWTASTQTVSTLVSTGLLAPYAVALDASGNVYIADSGHNAIKMWNASNSNVTTLVSSGINFPTAIALNASGDIYIADTGNNAIQKWSASTGAVSAFIATGLNNPSGVAVDGSGNVYIADNFHTVIKKWTAATQAVTTLISSGLNNPQGVSVDGSGNVYIADSGNNAVEELPRAFVDASTKTVSTGAGPGSVAEVLPTAANLLAPFAPSSDQSWLTIGSVTGGIVNFSYTANATGAGRSAHINLLGQPVRIAQQGPTPTVTSSSASLAANALTFTIQGTGFDPDSEGDTVTLSDGAVGVITAATATSLTVSITTSPTSTGTLTAVVTVNGVSSASAVQVATVQAVNALATAALTEGPSSGSDSVILTTFPASAAWTATANASWLHTASSGTGNGIAIFTFDANSGTTRSGTLTIGGQTLTVTQAGAGYAAANPLTMLANTTLSNPCGVALDAAGNVYVADYSNNAVRKWTVATQTLTTLDTSASPLNGPAGVAVDAAGNVYIADSGNNTLKIWNASSQTVSVLDTSASPLSGPSGVALDAAGNIYIADSNNNAVKKWTAATQALSTLNTGASPLNSPNAVALDPAGNVYIADTLNNAVKIWSPVTQTVSVLYSGLSYPRGVAVDASGNVYSTGLSTNAINKWTASTQTTTTAVTGLNAPFGVAVDALGNLYIGDEHNNAVEEVPRAFVMQVSKSETMAAGSDVLPLVLPTTENLLPPFVQSSAPSWLTVGSISSGVVNFSFTANTGAARSANLVVLGVNFAVSQPAGLTVTSSTATLAAGTNTLVIQGSGFDTIPGNNTVLFNNGTIGIVTSATGTSLTVTFTTLPTSVGNLTVVVTTDGASSGAAVQVATVPTALGTYASAEGPAAGSDSVILSMASQATTWTATSNAPWLSISAGTGSGTGNATVIFTFTANTGATRAGTLTIAGETYTVTQAGSTYAPANPIATLSSLFLYNPCGLALDAQGNVYIADYSSNELKKYTPADGTTVILNTSATTLNGPLGIAVDRFGNVYFSDSNNNAVKMWNPTTNAVTTLNTSSSPLNSPTGVALDGAGDLYIADSGNNVIKKWTVASSTLATLNITALSNPQGVAVDAAGNVVIGDAGHNAVKVWSPITQTATSVMTGLNIPRGVAVDNCGNVYVADTVNNAIQKWTAATQTVVPIVTGLNWPFGVTTDALGNLYYSDEHNNRVQERVRAFVDATSKTEPAGSATDRLPVILPSSQPLTVAFAPLSDQPWLTAGSASNGVESFSFTANDTSGSRTGHITLLGASISVTQPGGIAAWRYTWFSTTANTGAAANTADPNGNGIPNLLEYAFAGNPAANSPASYNLPSVSVSGAKTLQINFNYYLSNSDLTLTVQASDDLQTWTNLAQSVNGSLFSLQATGATINDPGPGQARNITVGDLYQVGDPVHPHRFMRVLVTGP